MGEDCTFPVGTTEITLHRCTVFMCVLKWVALHTKLLNNTVFQMPMELSSTVAYFLFPHFYIFHFNLNYFYLFFFWTYETIKRQNRNEKNKEKKKKGRRKKMVVQKCAIVVRTKRNQVSRKYGHAYRKRSRRKGEFFKGDYRREWCDRTISI